MTNEEFQQLAFAFDTIIEQEFESGDWVYIPELGINTTITDVGFDEMGMFIYCVASGGYYYADEMEKV